MYQQRIYQKITRKNLVKRTGKKFRQNKMLRIFKKSNGRAVNNLCVWPWPMHQLIKKL